jgi:hypothetical protein
VEPVDGQTERSQTSEIARTDRDGELYSRPSALSYVWGVLVVLLVMEAVNEIFGVGGPTPLYEGWVHDLILVSAALLILLRARYEPMARSAWLLIGLATLSWCVGSIGWSVVYGSQPNPPFPTFADFFWLLWYPLLAWGMVRLIQVRVQRFAWHRWMDGIAVMLVILGAGLALIVEPAADASVQRPIPTIIDFSYPVLDVLLIGAILGVYGLLGWHPDRMWLLLGTGILVMTGADTVYAIQEVGGVSGDEHYSFVWTAGALVVAFAAWARAPGPGDVASDEVSGLRAVALPLIAQGLAAGIQIYAFFGPIGRSERIVTVAVLVVSSVQIYLTRPRDRTAEVASTKLPLGVADGPPREGQVEPRSSTPGAGEPSSAGT